MKKIYSAKDFFSGTDFSKDFMQAYDALTQSSKKIVRAQNRALDQLLTEKEQIIIAKQQKKIAQHNQINNFTSQLESYLNKR